MALLAQLRAQRLAPAVLPHDGVMDRLAGLALPQQRGLALVRDAQRADVRGLQAGLGQRRACRGELAAPDLQRVMLDPARLRIDLRQFLLGQRDDAAALIKDDAARTGGALVECEEVRHGVRLYWNHGDRAS